MLRASGSTLRIAQIVIFVSLVARTAFADVGSNSNVVLNSDVLWNSEVVSNSDEVPRAADRLATRGTEPLTSQVRYSNASGCAATGSGGLAPFVMLAMVLLHLRRGGRSVLEAPKSRIVSRVFIAWPFDGASASASANDVSESPVSRPAAALVSVNAIADLTPNSGPANDTLFRAQPGARLHDVELTSEQAAHLSDQARPSSIVGGKDY